MGKFIASGSLDNTIRIWNLKGDCLLVLNGRGEAKSVCFSPDGKLIVSGHSDAVIYIWNLKGKCLAVLQGHTSDVNSISFSPDGSFLISGSADQSVKMWDLSRGFEQITLCLSTNHALRLQGANIQGAKDLSDTNRRLLLQRGAKES